jgi:hypothetical protein
MQEAHLCDVGVTRGLVLGMGPRGSLVDFGGTMAIFGDYTVMA